MSKVTKIKLGDIGKISMCKRILKSQTSSKGDIPFYKISTFGEKADCFISRELYEEYKTKYSFPKKGAILISAAGTLGRTVRYNGEDAFFQDSNIVWVDNDESKVLNDFLYYYYQLKPWKKTTGSTIERLYNDNLRDIDVVFPTDINEQRKLIKVLKEIDSKINNNNKIISEFEAMVKTIYNYWFLQYEFPNAEGKPYKSSNGKMVYNKVIEGAIPENWKVENIMNYVKWEGTSQPPKSCFIYEPQEGYVRFVQNRDYEDSSHLTFIPKDKALGICDKYDILMDKYGDAGKTRFGIEGAYNVALAKITVKDELYKEYIRNVLSSDAVYTYLHNSSMASTRASLNEKNVSYINIVVPDKETISKFNKIANNYIETAIKAKAENEELKKMREFLLPLLIDGRVQFED